MSDHMTPIEYCSQVTLNNLKGLSYREKKWGMIQNKPESVSLSLEQIVVPMYTSAANWPYLKLPVQTNF
jgi:hypothetical protein